MKRTIHFISSLLVSLTVGVLTWVFIAFLFHTIAGWLYYFNLFSGYHDLSLFLGALAGFVIGLIVWHDTLTRLYFSKYYSDIRIWVL